MPGLVNDPPVEAKKLGWGGGGKGCIYLPPALDIQALPG